MSNELATRAGGLQISSVSDLARVSEMFAQSGYFNDARDAAQAGVKILAGQGWGIAPFDAMTGVHIIQGRATIGAHLIAAKVKASGKYDYRVRTMTDEECSIEFYQAGESIGVSTFTIKDAKKAGTKNLDKFPRNMLYARAMSNGYRWYCPDVFTGPVYTPEELGAEVDGEGNVVTVEAKPAKAKAKALEAKSEPAAAPEASSDIQVDEAASGDEGQFPEEPPEGTLSLEEPQRTQLGTANAKRLADKLDAAGIPKKEHVAVAGQAVGRELTALTDLYRDELPVVLGFAESAGGEPTEAVA